jgi:hypothetical protein
VIVLWQGDNIYYCLYQKLTPEMRRMHLWGIVEEANKNFLLASKRWGDDYTLKRHGQVKLNVSNDLVNKNF